MRISFHSNSFYFSVDASSIQIDPEKLFLVIEQMNLGWTAERITKAVALIVTKYASVVLERAKMLAKDAIRSAQEAVEKEILKLGPNVIFQARATWMENCCNKATWTGGGANPQGKTILTALVGAGFELNAGAAAGLNLTVPIKIQADLKVVCKIMRCNPVSPTSGNGSSLVIYATPVWEYTPEGKITATSGVSATVGGGVGDSGILPEVIGTLNCP
jgi:hypothetical protein